MLESEDLRGRNADNKEGTWKEFSSIKATNLQIDPELSARILNSKEEKGSTERDERLDRILKVRGKNVK